MTNHKTIVKTLDQMHCIFATDGYDIGKEWAHLLSKASCPSIAYQQVVLTTFRESLLQVCICPYELIDFAKLAFRWTQR